MTNLLLSEAAITSNTWCNLRYNRLLFIAIILCLTDMSPISSYCLYTQTKKYNNIHFSIAWPKKKVIPPQLYFQNVDFFHLVVRYFTYVVVTTWILSLIILSNDIETNPGPNDSGNASFSSNHSSSSSLLSHGLSVMHLNIQSLRPKLDILEIEAQPYDILVFSETWLSPAIDSNSLLIPNFNPPLRCDRIDRLGGGVALYLKDTLACTLRQDLSIPNLEAIWVQIIHDNKTLLIGGFYRPPNSNNNYWSLIEESFDRAYSTNIDNVIILGDFNINMNQKHDNKLSNLISSYQSYQLISEPTHFTENSSSIIDIISVKRPESVVSSFVADCFFT